MNYHFKHGLSIMLAFAMIIGLLSGLPITANAANDTVLREAIAKRANTFCATAAVRNDGMVMFDNTMESYIINGWTNVASIAEPVELVVFPLIPPAICFKFAAVVAEELLTQPFSLAPERPPLINASLI